MVNEVTQSSAIRERAIEVVDLSRCGHGKWESTYTCTGLHEDKLAHLNEAFEDSSSAHTKVHVQKRTTHM